MTRIFKYYLLSFFSLNLLAGEICFDRTENIKKAKSELQSILHKDDSINVLSKTNCLFIVSPDYRHDLYNQYLARGYQLRHASSLSKSECNLKVTREGKGKSKRNVVRVGKHGIFSETISKSGSRRVSKLKMTSGIPGTINVDDSRLEVLCRNLHSHYQLKISLHDVIDANLSNLVSTEVLLQRGSRIELGEVVKDLNRKTKRNQFGTAGVNIERSKTRGQQQYNYFLEVD